MDASDRDRIIRRYDERLAQYGNDIRTLASGTEERRRLRFGILCGVGPLEGRSILDLGCGFGDLFGYLREKGWRGQYTGYDINPSLIEIARSKYPEATFDIRDIQEQDFPQFDYILSTSAFNLRLEGGDNYKFVSDILTRCFARAHCGVAMDFMSTYVDYQAPEAFHYSPERLFEIGRKMSRYVTVRHDYPLYEFCVYIYKNPPNAIP
jgi:SAM-dependent methyltransferase